MQIVISYEKHRAAPQGLTRHMGQAVGFVLTMHTGPVSQTLPWYLPCLFPVPPFLHLPWNPAPNPRGLKNLEQRWEDQTLKHRWWLSLSGKIWTDFYFFPFSIPSNFSLTKNIYCFYIPKTKINKAIFKNLSPLRCWLQMKARREWKMTLIWLERMTGKRGGRCCCWKCPFGSLDPASTGGSGCPTSRAQGEGEANGAGPII